MDKTSDIIFFVVTVTVVLVLLSVLLINLLLLGRNRKLKHKNELLKITADYQKEVMKTQVEVVENTLNEISKQLHDDVGQMITLSIVQLNNLETKESNFKNEISSIRSSVQASLQSVREISKALSTDYITSFGISEALQRLILQVEKTTALSINLKLPESVLFHAKANELFVFRIIQELITNTIKHAKATEISISLLSEVDNLIVEYSDNGIGLENEVFDFKNSLGFTNICKRVDLMKGKIILLNEKKGFALKLEFPN